MSNFPSTALHDRITADLLAEHKPYRVIHIFGVLQVCLSLGAIHGADSEKLIMAALLHDCAKNVGRDETLKLVEAGAISLSLVDQGFPPIWHGAVGAYIAQTRYGVTDQEVLQAVEHHTLGCKNPSPTLQILMCADFCEPTRQYPEAGALRRLIRDDLRKGLLAVLNLKLEDLVNKDKKPHPGIYSTIESLEN